MALDASPSDVLAALVKSVSAGMAGKWVATPVPERLAILAREEVIRFVRETFPAAAIEKEDAPTMRHLAVRVFTPRDCHRVEVVGAECGGAVEAGPLAEYSWVLVAHACGGSCGLGARALEASGLRKIQEIAQPSVTLALWMGPRAPEGCPACLPVPKDSY